MNPNETQTFFKHFKIIKIVQMSALILIELLFFLILVTNPALRNSIYSNRSLFILSAMMWGLMIFSFICIFYDFHKMENVAARNYQLTRIAYLDELTGIPNRSSFNHLLTEYTLNKKLAHIGLGIIEISNLEEINRRAGHDAGDTAIRDFAFILDDIAAKHGQICRNGGNEYLVLLENCDATKMEHFLHILDDRINQYNETTELDDIQLHYEYVLNKELQTNRFSDIITLAHKKLHHLI